jgi:hypothetical protein
MVINFRFRDNEESPVPLFVDKYALRDVIWGLLNYVEIRDAIF